MPESAPQTLGSAVVCRLECVQTCSYTTDKLLFLRDRLTDGYIIDPNPWEAEVPSSLPQLSLRLGYVTFGLKQQQNLLTSRQTAQAYEGG